MARPDPSIFDEPHMQHDGWNADPSERKAEDLIQRESSKENPDDAVGHSIWQEPTTIEEFHGPPTKDAATYKNWLTWRISQTTTLDTWALSLCWAFLAGPWAILGVFIGSIYVPAMIAPIHIVVIAPVAEELMKIAIPLWIVERRPYMFRSRLQIVACALAGGIIFAAVENAMYLNVSLFDWSNPLTRWRWTICVMLHTGCCFVSAMGLSRIWKKTVDNFSLPSIQTGVPYFVTAMVLHGSYNAFAIAFEWLYEPF